MSERDVLLAKREVVKRYFPQVKAFVAGLVAMPRSLDYSPARNVVGVGVAEKVTGNRLAGCLAVRIYVKRKVAKGELARRQYLPQSVAGVPVDIVESGEIVAEVRAKKDNATLTDKRRTRLRPAPGGVSCGHCDTTAGTLGCVVKDAKTNKTLILSNNHVLANCNDGKKGEPILQPGPHDGGNDKDKIGELARFRKLDYSGTPNDVDAAVASVKKSDVSEKICLIGKLKGRTLPSRGMVVVKHGRTTGKTQGVVEDVDADIWVDYLPHGYAYFRDAIAIRGTAMTPEFSAGGDSGSIIVEEASSKACALLFSGSSALTFGNRIDLALKAMRVSL